jgi:hypothetical protein
LLHLFKPALFHLAAFWPLFAMSATFMPLNSFSPRTQLQNAGGNKMRDFNFNGDATASNGDATTSTANFAGNRPLETQPEVVILPEAVILDVSSQDDTSSLRSFQVEQDNEESSNIPKIVGAVMVGLLIVGGGLYAYETSFSDRAPVKTVAMRTTAAPTNMAALAPPSTPVATPESVTPVKSAAITPIPETETVKQSAANVPSNPSGAGVGPTSDPAISAPMTLTPDTAPAPQGSPGQTGETNLPGQSAMQQPITTPDVGNTSQPTASIAANQPSGATPSTPAAEPDPAPTEQLTQQPVQIQPAQIQPSQIEPSQAAPQ